MKKVNKVLFVAILMIISINTSVFAKTPGMPGADVMSLNTAAGFQGLSSPGTDVSLGVDPGVPPVSMISVGEPSRNISNKFLTPGSRIGFNPQPEPPGVLIRF